MEIFCSEFSLRDPLALHHHDRQPFGTSAVNRDPIHMEKIEDVASNGGW